MKILFICKKNEVYSFVSYTRRSSGLYNSTAFIVKGLRRQGIDAEIIEVHDNDSIDREVTHFKPDVVIIEALWVVPSKFPILQKLHPKVKWFVHLHSHMPFLALEGISMEWIPAYARLGVGLIANSKASYHALRAILNPREVLYLPNVYIGKMRKAKVGGDFSSLHIGCFGAVRPLKNQLLQALAAIQFAREKNRFLYFYINASRVETGGGPVLKELRSLFRGRRDAMLVEKHWHEPEAFIDLLHQKIDLGMQVSLTETFNVVCADYVTAGIPVVASKEVTWVSKGSKAKDDSIVDIVKKMHDQYGSLFGIWENQLRLFFHSQKAQRLWYEFVINHGVEFNPKI